jgi:hypothetical protein
MDAENWLWKYELNWNEGVKFSVIWYKSDHERLSPSSMNPNLGIVIEVPFIKFISTFYYTYVKRKSWKFKLLGRSICSSSRQTTYYSTLGEIPTEWQMRVCFLHFYVKFKSSAFERVQKKKDYNSLFPNSSPFVITKSLLLRLCLPPDSLSPPHSPGCIHLELARETGASEQETVVTKLGSCLRAINSKYFTFQYNIHEWS